MSSRGHRRRVLLTTLTVTVLAAGAALIAVAAWTLLSPAPSPSTERRPVATSAEQITDADAAVPLALDIPVIGFRAEILPLAADAGTVIDPPTAAEAYWLSDYGLPGIGAEDTVYLVGHASADGRAVFDPLVDRTEQTSTLLPGDEIVVETENGSVVYAVVAAERHDKQRLAELDGLWSSSPGRLVLITCFFSATDGTASDNMVVFARQRAES